MRIDRFARAGPALGSAISWRKCSSPVSLWASDARDTIEPTSILPAVRPPSGTMEPAEVNTNRFARLSGGLIEMDCVA